MIVNAWLSKETVAGMDKAAGQCSCSSISLAEMFIEFLGCHGQRPGPGPL
jgi:hypothetical protein